MNLNELTIKEARNLLDNKKISATDLTEACLLRIKKIDKKIKACLTINESEALLQAKKSDLRIKSGEKGDLLGIPYLVKDNIVTKNLKTTAASKILEDYIPNFDATVIKKLKTNGAILLGKTNLDEFAHGASTENSAFEPTHNPYDLKKTPGGSSGGSAAAVASDMCLFALGSDTGGSVRHPASFCGTVGLKPTYGTISRFGLISMTSSTDVIGILAKNSEDALTVYKKINGHDKNDSTTIKKLPKKENINIKNLTIGLPKEYFLSNISEEIKKSINTSIKYFEKLGAKITEISLPHTKYGVNVYYILTPSELSSNLARFDGLRFGQKKEADNLIEQYFKNRSLFGEEAKRRIMLGTYALSSGYYDAYYLKAQKIRTKIIKDFELAFRSVDLIISPTTPNTAFNLGEKIEPLKMYLEDIFLTPTSLAGLPAVSIPCGYENKMPIGMQIIGDKYSEDKILKLGELHEKYFKKIKAKI